MTSSSSRRRSLRRRVCIRGDDENVEEVAGDVDAVVAEIVVKGKSGIRDDIGAPEVAVET